MDNGYLFRAKKFLQSKLQEPDFYISGFWGTVAFFFFFFLVVTWLSCSLLIVDLNAQKNCYIYALGEKKISSAKKILTISNVGPIEIFLQIQG